MARVLSECLVRQRSVGTTLIVCPDLFPNNFRSYLEVHNMIQDGLLVDHELSEDLQIAPFHPKFEFDGSGPDGIDNLTNQSPYPMFHILREKDVAHAVDILDGDASKVWKQNIQFLEELDSEFDRNQIENLLFTGAAAGGGKDHHHQQQDDEDDEDTNYDDVRKKAKDILKRIKRQNNKR